MNPAAVVVGEEREDEAEDVNGLIANHSYISLNSVISFPRI